jgi:hypothetical protein
MPGTRMASRLAEDNTRAKCTQVIIVEEKGEEERNWWEGKLTENA